MSNNNKQKLELTWIGKNNPEYDISNIEPRILEENPKLSNCKDDSNTENVLIHGDNLLALKALLPEYEGKIKCIYIDPPYNTGNAFEHYDDSVEHSTWLSLMKPRLELLGSLLTDDGVIFVQIDDEEQAYLRVLLDDIFGRENFINTIVVKMKNIAGASGGGEDKRLKKNVEFIHVYSKNYNLVRQFKGVYDLTEIASLVKQYRVNKISWKYTSILIEPGEKKYIASTVDGEGNEIKIFKRTNPVFKSVGQIVKEENISEKEVYYKYAKKIFTTAMPQSSIRVRVLDTIKKIDDVTDLLSIEYIPRSGKNKGLVYEQFYKGEKLRLLTWLYDVLEEKNGVLYKKDLQGTYWDGLNLNNLTKEGLVEFPNGKKPEALLEKIISMSTDVGEMVLDSFLGSGTTAAVAHKIGRKYIGIEMEDHAYTHCKARLDKVIEGADQGGISKLVDWKGGGAYKFYELAPSFIIKDEFGNPVIDSFYDNGKLIRAMCRLMNFTYKPSHSEYWKQGIGQGKNYIYVTTQLLTSGMVQQIAGHLAKGESLVICPSKFEPGADKIDERITIKKIPQSVLKACHFGKKEYLLPIKETAMEEAENEPEEEDNN
jgi:adenine-specific DNA-methyltransferase